MPNNVSGLSDNVQDFDPWIELLNSGATAVSLAGWALTDDLQNLLKWPFPTGLSIPAGGFLLVWLDGETTETVSTHLHAGFRAPLPSGTIALTASEDNTALIVDYVTYANPELNQTIGLARDGDPLTRTLLPRATPGAPNGSIEDSPTLALSLDNSGTVTLSWRCASGRVYRVETSTASDLPRWTAVANGTGDGGIVTFTDKINSLRSRFYRIALP
jgi:hypothetical protein